ncbi:MAG: two-component system alkaline phosphatase synthesis response regulator PhoP [Kiritimatiellia bacterium]|jgi:CheY-like chemotaxis protein
MSQKKILIVDDEETFTRIVKLNLEDTGKYEVKVENNPRQAIEVAKWFDPDVTVLDVIMPEMSGLEVADELRAFWGDSPRPIIFLTAAISKEDASMQHEMMQNAPLLAKPVDVEELIQALDQVTS